MNSINSRRQRAVAIATFSGLFALTAGHAIAAAQPNDGPRNRLTPVDYGVDRSNMATEWTLAFPQEPNIAPFLAADYNKPGDFEARRAAVINGIARIHAGWFRDGIDGSALSISMLKLLHANGMRMLAIIGPKASDYPPGAYISKARSGCPWGTYPLSKIDLPAYQSRVEAEFASVRAAGETIDAFEIGNEFDLYCNDADDPTAADWAKHRWKWFLAPAQVQTFVRGYAPFLSASVASIRKFFPQAEIITYGNSMPASAPLIAALANVQGAGGKVTDYTKLVDGYGSHLYPNSTTTLGMVNEAISSLRYEAAYYPHMDKKSIWITEWNPAGSSWWNGQPWYFQYDAQGQPGGELNKADTSGVFKAMDRATAIRTFNQYVILALRNSTTAPVDVSHVFYYSYDSGEKSSKCDNVKYSWTSNLSGFCIDGLIDPYTGNLLPEMAKAVDGR